MRANRLSPSRFSVARLTTAAALLAALTACGYKGPLYMPAPPAAPDATLTTPPSHSQPLSGASDDPTPAKASAIE